MKDNIFIGEYGFCIYCKEKASLSDLKLYMGCCSEECLDAEDFLNDQELVELTWED